MKEIIVYIAHPIGGAVASNIICVEKILDQILQSDQGVWPIAPYLDACKYLEDNKENRERCFAINKMYFDTKFIDQLWVFGRSPGVEIEIGWAIENGIDILFYKK